MKKYLSILFTLLFSTTVFAQVPVRDRQKENQIRSMEQGYWNFSPDWWYWAFHKNYSGAYTKWHCSILIKESEFTILLCSIFDMVMTGIPAD